MKKRNWLKPVLILAFLIAIGVAAYLIIPQLLAGRGVSATAEDIMNVITAIKPYLIIIGVALLMVLLAFVLTASRRAKPVAKLVARRQSVVLALVAVILSVNLMCNGPLSPLLNVSMAAKGEMSTGTEERSHAIAKQIAEEGIVLLKNEGNALPLSASETKLNVFGWSSTNPLYGGTGSGEFADTADVTTLLQGLQNAGFELNTELSEFYVKEEDTRPEIGMYIQDWTIPEAKIKDMDRKKLFENAKAFSDVALIVISRSGGEGADLPMSITDENTVAQAATTGRGVRYTSQKDDIDPEKHYLELTNRETALVERVNQEFGKVIVIVNSANTMELGWVNQYEHIKGVVWCAGAGESGFAALGEVLNGTINPSGHTVDTYLYDLLSSPAAKNIGNFEYDNTDSLVNVDTSTSYKATFVNYVEGIYVGYKFYETAAEEGLIDYDATVQYPFGYGLSYTTFSQEITDFKQDDKTVTLKVSVKNTGSVSGKDVVETYYTPPYTNGGIEKAAVNLIAFAKTDLLAPGASQTLELSFALEDMASYDYLVNGCYVLEAGEYGVSIRSDSHTVLDSRTFTLAQGKVYSDAADGARSSDSETATNRFEYAQGDVTYLSRADHFANFAKATAAPASYSMSDEAKAGFLTNANYNAAADTNPDAQTPTVGAGGSLTIADMADVPYDDSKWEQLLNQMSTSEMITLVTKGGYMTAEVPSIGLKATIETDGPSGLHSNFTELNGTSFPSPVMIASTWNQELALERGRLVGLQGVELGISGWYGPAMNIHRTAFSGRNFEYYSEDGVLSGLIAAREVAGAREYNMQTYVKHFALNDQETNRISMLCTWSNEQAIREIYLKPFEIAFKQGGAKSVMSSYNYIGNKWAGANDELLNGVLRGEWGVNCVVVTDWYGGYGFMNADLAIRNGGDRMLTTTDMASLADTTSATSLEDMRTACKNILYSIANSSVIKGLAVGTPTWKLILNGANIAVGAMVVLLEILFVVKLHRDTKKKAAVQNA